MAGAIEAEITDGGFHRQVPLESSAMATQALRDDPTPKTRDADNENNAKVELEKKKMVEKMLTAMTNGNTAHGEFGRKKRVPSNHQTRRTKIQRGQSTSGASNNSSRPASHWTPSTWDTNAINKQTRCCQKRTSIGLRQFPKSCTTSANKDRKRAATSTCG